MSADVGESLDDFFAKKDKKKKTKKSKSAFTPDDFHPVNEKPKKKTKSGAPKAVADAVETPETTKEGSASPRTAETKKIEESDLNAAVDVSGVRSEEDEWNDFAAEHQIDYSGLRIQKLNIQEDAADEEEEVEYDDEGKVIGAAEIQVWKIPEIPACRTPEPTTEVQSTVGMEKTHGSGDKDPDDGNSSSSSPAPQKYIPPAQRQAMKAAKAAAAAGGQSSIPRTLGGPRRNPRMAPDISNEELFPTLGGKGSGPGKSGAWGGAGGLGSNASSRGQSPLTSGGGKLITDVSLENKWDALTRGAE